METKQTEMNEQQIFEINLKNKTKIKEEVIDVEIEIKNENVSEVDVSLSTLSYGEIFILQVDEEKPYLWWIRCNICQEKFTSFENFFNHAADTHLKNEPAKFFKAENENIFNFKIEIKNENVSEVDVLLSALSYGEIFILQVDEENPYLCWIKCNICQEKFTGFENFLNHVADTHLKIEPAIVFKAENENLYNENSFNYDNNDNIYNKNTETQLDEVNEDLDNKVESDVFVDNEEIKNVEKNKTNSVLNIKSEKYTKQKPSYCEICEKTFKRPAASCQHLKLHLKNYNKVYECKICHETFSQDEKRLYCNHRARAHREKIPCTLCEKTFKSKFYLDSHMMMHTGVKDFKCNQCSAEYYSKTSLTEHVRKQHLITTNVCEQCGSSFQTLRLLQSHIRRHNNDRRYECDVCGKKFFDNTYLRVHKVIHTDEKPYECDICNVRFNSRPTLFKHKNIHSGVKKYQCKICGKAYAQSPGLYAHMKSHKIA